MIDVRSQFQAHKKASERAFHLNQQLEIYRAQTLQIQKELETTLEREKADRQNRNEWAKARLEMLKTSTEHKTESSLLSHSTTNSLRFATL